MRKPGQGILVAALVVLLVLLVGMALMAVAEIRSSARGSSELRVVAIAFLVMGVLIVGVVRALRDR